MGYAFRRGTPFWDRVDVRGPDDCWPWLAGKGSHGYGQMYGDRPGLAHRVAYEDRVGPIPAGLTIDHLCNNRTCCNPAHMEVVSRGENARRGEKNRKVRSGRSRPDLTERSACVNGHDFNEANSYKRGNARICRVCAADRTARFRAKRAHDLHSPRGGDG